MSTQSNVTGSLQQQDIEQVAALVHVDAQGSEPIARNLPATAPTNASSNAQEAAERELPAADESQEETLALDEKDPGDEDELATQDEQGAESPVQVAEAPVGSAAPDAMSDVYLAQAPEGSDLQGAQIEQLYEDEEEEDEDDDALLYLWDWGLLSAGALIAMNDWDSWGGPAAPPPPAPPPASAVAITSITDDSGRYDNDFVTSDQTLTISGTSNAADGATVQVKVNDEVVGTATVMGGAWSFVYETELMDGNYTLGADLLDAEDSIVASAADQNLVIDTSGTEDENGDPDPIADEEIAVSSISDDTGPYSDDFVTNDQALVINGTSTAADGAHVAVKVDGNIVGYTTVDGDGAWSFNYTGTMLAIGTYTLDADLVDLAGNVAVSAADQSLVIDTSGTEDENGDPDPLANAEITVYAVTDDTGTAGDLTTTDQTLEIYGESTADTGSHVAVKVNGNIVGYTTVDGDGAWSFDYTGTTLPVGTYTLDADLVDLAGNVAATAEDRTLVVEAASEETPLALTTSLNGVTNLDVKSALVLNFNQDISLSDGQIRILDMMGTSGWTLSNISTDVSRQDVTGNDVVITLADGVVTGMTIGGVDYTALGTNGIS
ncbi:MAG: Ig-like domain-containing protein, partial [Hydrogenophaga sp.]